MKKIVRNVGKIVAGFLVLGIALGGRISAKFRSSEFLVLDRDLAEVTLANLDSHLDGVKLPLPEEADWIEPGIIVRLSCVTGRPEILPADDAVVAQFHENFGEIVARARNYDRKFLGEIASAALAWPGNHQILDTLVAEQLGADWKSRVSEDLKNSAKNSTKKFKILKAGTAMESLCGPRVRRENSLGAERHFLRFAGMDFAAGTEIIPREVRGADERISGKDFFKKEQEKTVEDDDPPRTISQISLNYAANFATEDEPKVFLESGNPDWRPVAYFPVERIIVHHTASKLARSAEEGKKYLQNLQRYHGAMLGWGDIGYHFLIDGEGNIFEGRRGKSHSVGAHVLGHNRGSVGIGLISDAEYPPAMMKSLISLVLWLSEKYGLDPTEKFWAKNDDLTGREWGDVVVAHKELTPRKPVDPMIPMGAFREIVEKIRNDENLRARFRLE